MSEQEEKSAAHEIAAWLRRHPDFLRQFPDLAQTLTVPRETGAAASLASYQLDVLRDKNRELNRRLHELFANAMENERLAVRTHQLTLALMAQRSARDVVQAMAASLGEDFQGDWVRIVLFRPVPELAANTWLRYYEAEDSALLPFRDVLAGDEPLCGRLNPDKNALLYGELAEAVQSSALLPLPGIGMIAIGSRDGNRFFPGMGTLFLRMMAQAFAAALGRSGSE